MKRALQAGAVDITKKKSKSLFNNSFVIRNLGAFLAQSAKNRAFRSKSSDLLMQILWAFRYNPLRGSSEPVPVNCCGN
jgi:hypothetical protein